MQQNLVLGSAAAAFIGAAIAGSGVLAQATSPAGKDQEAGRYVLEREGEYFVRMDRQTGAMSLCTMEGGELVCRIAADERETLLTEIDALQSRLAARAQDDGVQDGSGKSAKRAERGDRPGSGQYPSHRHHGFHGDEDGDIEKEFDRALDFASRAMRRLMGVMREMRDDLQQ